MCKGEKSYGCINDKQIQWYISESKRYNKKYKRIIPGVVFLHVPPQEYLYGMTVYNYILYIIIINIIIIFYRRIMSMEIKIILYLVHNIILV